MKKYILWFEWTFEMLKKAALMMIDVGMGTEAKIFQAL